MLYIILAILMFGILIALHELGHFLAAKALGVRVNEFAIGMGPQLLHKQGKETVYSLRLFPIGGFCAMEGEDENSDDPKAFGNQKAWKRFLILAAGSFANFLTGVVLIMLLFTGAQAFIGTTVSGFMDGFPYQGEEYLMPGDQILKINGERIYVKTDFNLLLSRTEGKPVDLTIRRNGTTMTLTGLDLELREYTDENGQVGRYYGLYFGLEPATFLNWVKYSLNNAFDFVRMVRLSLTDLFSGRAGMKDLTGPIGIIDTIGQVGESAVNWKAALQNILYFSAFLAVNLAVMNLLPLPALDGGRIFFLLVNSLFVLLTRKKLDPKYEGYVHMAGLVLLLGLMVVVAFNDIVRIVAR